VFFAEYPHLGTGSVKVGKKTDRSGSHTQLDGAHGGFRSSTCYVPESAVNALRIWFALLARPGNTDPLNLFERHVKT
jgi:hypothetical protein